MKRSPSLFATLVILFFAGQLHQDATAITLLHEFAGGTDDGRAPLAGLTVSGTTLFGTTNNGGDSDRGTIFSMDIDGSGFTLLHEFAGFPNDGAFPHAGVILSGTTLFGTTVVGGGNGNNGTVFSIDTNGSDFTLLHEFAFSDGAEPEADLLLSGSTLFGTTIIGPNDGTLFSIDTDGTDFTLVHVFDFLADGSTPGGDLIESGSTLFGTTFFGGSGTHGILFSVETDGSDFTLLHEFAGGANDGRTPRAGVTLSGSTLFGTTYSGGDNNLGTVFSINTDGSDFTLLHEFAGNDGSGSVTDLILSGTTLFGSTREGGANDFGTIFSINTDGSEFTLLHEFAGGANDGSGPWGDLILSGSTLFGTTEAGGDDDRGTIFSIVIPEPGGLLLTLTAFGVLGFYRASRRGNQCPL